MRRIAVTRETGSALRWWQSDLRVLEAAAADSEFGYEYETVAFPWGLEHYLSTGSMMDPDALGQLASFDAIYFVALGSPEVPDHVTLWVWLEIVQGFDQAISLRRARLLSGVRGRSPAAAR